MQDKGVSVEAQLTIRLPKELADKLKAAAGRLGVKKSDVARMAIREYLGKEGRLGAAGPYELVQHLIGSVSSGIPDLGERHRDYLVEKLKKHA